MYRFDDVYLRLFEEKDIELKVKWVNDSRNNQYLHYDLPLELEKTRQWYLNNRDNKSRWDATVVFNGEPVGLFGLININYEKKEAEDYSLIGEVSAKGKGIGTKAGILNLAHAFYDLGLERVWGTIETSNYASLNRWKKSGGNIGEVLPSYYGENRDAVYVYVNKDDFTLPANCTLINYGD